MKMAFLLVLALAVIQSVYSIEPTFPATSATSSSPTVTSGSLTTNTASSTSSTTSSSSATASPTLTFYSISSQLNTCSSFTVSWLWGIDGIPLPKNMTLSVTNINVTQQDPPTSSSSQILNTFTDTSVVTLARRQIIPSVASGSVIATGTVSASSGSSTPLPGLLESLSTTLDPSSQTTFTWDKVNLPQGWYEFLATATDAGDVAGGVGGIFTTWNATSDPFFIWNSSDVSCLAVITSPSTSSGSSGATNTAGQSSPSAGGSLSTSSSVNGGAIAGGVIGGIAAVVILIGAYLSYRARSRKNVLDGNGRSSRPNFGKWGALGSFDSSNGNGPRSATKSGAKTEGADKFDPVTVLNTAANSRPQKSGGFSLGDMGLAALGLAKSQNSPPSAYSTQSKRDRRSRHAKQSSGTVESAAGMMSSSFSSSMFSPSSSSANDHFDPYAEGRIVRTTDEEFGYSAHDHRAVPMRNLSPTSSPTEEGYPKYHSYMPSSESLDSGAPGVGTIPIGYEASPFVTPPPSEPASRHNSRSYSRTSLTSSNAQALAFSALGMSNSPTSEGFRQNRARSQSQNASPTSVHPRRGPDSPESPRTEFSSKRASSPDAFVYTLNPVEQTQSGSSVGKGQTKRAHRKPVPSYVPDEALGAFTETPTSPVYTYSGTAPSKPPKAATGSRRPAPNVPTPSESASSSSSSFPAPMAHAKNAAAYGRTQLEHKDSAHSLASLRNMEGDLSGYGAVLGNEGVKQMHVLIPDMPLPQS
ncbi:hypothetical protein F5878DRAFT_621322 [Lentinula raphanica]|uniref:Uncharacterized protein n=1 Tax=Lentinula raphanica TaxID=153919 RepID=A0AA38UDV2_9AGAR|nr:hypothetical protein F5878DRAFT_621322 [Lentinula raphanica]